MRLYDEDAQLNGWKPSGGNTGEDWQNRAIDVLINVITSWRWKWRRISSAIFRGTKR